jgi:hypothetical protein
VLIRNQSSLERRNAVKKLGRYRSLAATGGRVVL